MSVAISATGAQMEQRVRRALKEYPRLRTDKANGDAATTQFDLGKNIGMVSQSETVIVDNVTKTRGVDYTIGPEFGVTDYGSMQLSFATAPGAGTLNVVCSYRETPYPSESIYDGLTAGVNMLYPKFYKMDYATWTCQNNVRDYNLTQVVDQPALRTLFGQSNGTWKGLNMRVQPYGANVDEFWTPYKWYSYEWYQSQAWVHLWRIRGVNDVMKFNIMRSFFPIADASTAVDVPGHLQELVILYACAQLTLKQEPIRVRQDTAAVLQSNFANPPSAVQMVANDFERRFWLMYNRMPSEPPTFEIQDIPLPFQTGYRWY